MSGVTIYTDGACKGNPGPGGWGALLIAGEREKELFGGERATTNNRMELMAVIRGLQSLACDCDVDLWTDSQYVKNGIETWIHNWKRNGWKTADRKPVKNADLWRELDKTEHMWSTTFEQYMSALLHVIEVAGVDHVCFGGDWDGGGGIAGMEDITALPVVTQRLLAAGYSQADIGKMTSGNVLRIMRAAQAAAGH